MVPNPKPSLPTIAGPCQSELSNPSQRGGCKGAPILRARVAHIGPANLCQACYSVYARKGLILPHLPTKAKA